MLGPYSRWLAVGCNLSSSAHAPADVAGDVDWQRVEEWMSFLRAALKLACWMHERKWVLQETGVVSFCLIWIAKFQFQDNSHQVKETLYPCLFL